MSVNLISDNAFCSFGEWGSENAEPLDAIIPISWNRSSVSKKIINENYYVSQTRGHKHVANPNKKS